MIPVEMKAIPHWVVWKYEDGTDKDGKPKKTKVLYRPKNVDIRASSTDPTTWTDYQKAEAAATLPGVDGIGFCFDGSGVMGIDFDHVRDPDTGRIDADAWQEIQLLSSYTEVSPSGTGVHVICLGKKPGPKCKCGEHREIYDHGRFLTVTGNHVPGTRRGVQDSQNAVEALYKKWFPPEPEKPHWDIPAPTAGDDLSDEEIVGLMKKARNYADIARLVKGDTSGYPSQSEADSALCCHLAYYTRDPRQIDRIFRQSGLYRSKWDEKHGGATYGDTTISNALSVVKERYKRPSHYKPGSITDRVKRVHDVKNKKGEVIGQSVSIDHQDFVACMVEKYHCVSVAGNVWIYADGYYRPDKGEIQAELSTVIKELGLQVQTIPYKEIRAMLAGTNFYRDSPFNYKLGIIPARNGVIHIDFKTGEVSGPHPHSPDNLFTYCLKADFDPTAPIEPVTTLFKQWVAAHDVGILSQFPAQGFIQSMIDASYKKSYLFQGETNSGKSSYFELIYRTIGDDDGTISHISIHAMCERPFSLYEMENRILNIYDDLDGAELTNHGRFKNITGNTHHPIEKKHSAGYSGRIFCSHGFSCNAPPKIPDKIKYDPAFWDRWEYTVFPNEYAKDPKFYERTYTPELLSGFLNLIVKSIVDIYVKDKLIQNSTYEQVMEKWLQDSDPLLQFIEENTNQSERLQYFSKARLFEAYSKWFDEQDLPPRRKITTFEKFSRDIQPHGFLTTKYSVNPGEGRRKIRVPCFAANRVWGEGQLQMEPTSADSGQSKITASPDGAL